MQQSRKEARAVEPWWGQAKWPAGGRDELPPPTSSARTLCGDSGATVSRGHRLPDLEAVTPSLGSIEKARPAVRTGGHREGAPVAPNACRAHSQPSSSSHRFSSTRGSVPSWFRKASAEGLGKHTPARTVTYRTWDTGRRDWASPGGGLGSEDNGRPHCHSHRALTTLPGLERVAVPRDLV